MRIVVLPARVVLVWAERILTVSLQFVEGVSHELASHRIKRPLSTHASKLLEIGILGSPLYLLFSLQLTNPPLLDARILILSLWLVG